MKYNFDEIIERKGTDCIKWDYIGERFGKEDIVPMWVADMDFKAPPAVVDALVERAAHGIYGYTGKTDQFFDSIVRWNERRFGWKTKKEWYTGTPGVVPALIFSILAFSHPGDEIIVQTPVYYPFFNAIEKNGRKIVENPLIYENGKYLMDFEDLKKKISKRTRIIILCSPHNPVGRVWKKEELQKFGELCLENGILIISDEIHCDLVYGENRHIPFANISKEFSDNSITLMAPSKTFNIAGLHTSVSVIPNEEIRNKFEIVLENLGLFGNSLFGIEAFRVAYNEGEEWLEQLKEYVYDNYIHLKDFLKNETPLLKVTELEGTYLSWIDCQELNMTDEQLDDFFLYKVKVGLNAGPIFGKNGSGFQRINLACPKSTLNKMLENLKNVYTEITS